MRIAIIGCGLIGEKRARAVPANEVAVCCDLDGGRAKSLASQFAEAEPATDWHAVIARPDIHAVIVATTHDALAPIAAEAAGAGKHVLIEKPGARRAAELDPVARAAARTGAIVRIGFNHRYHRAFRKAREIFASGALGDMLYVRGRYGHGGRPGYEREWRADPEVSGGGELMDQGTHLIDLARWFLGDFAHVDGYRATYFWEMPVEDNGFLLLRTATNRVAFLHASWTEWKNLFSFEIFGRRGKLEVSGLGGSYGVERVTHYKMSAALGPPETISWEYPMPDDSWQVEFSAFLDDIRRHRTPEPGIPDAQAALRVIEQVYRSQKDSSE
jgi:predicted dehydrogenase